MQKVGGREGCPFFVMVMCAESPINHLRITYESPKIYSGKIVKEKGMTKPN